ncbi:hypothetical protein CQW23_16636 [Capsicum baccatum]|uniref:Uncharacterized protein n=1 Tax=Capsicum baccatum TaxID=33114 RepID=A0A2G2WBI3_CAPBA|nr:hypothetical protein CQW23_16636 [Capsicum baccatum]
MKSVDMGHCESCVMGKQKRVSFTKTAREPKKVRLRLKISCTKTAREPKKVRLRLEMVYTDVWGPSPVSSRGGSRFYVTFIDDFSRKVQETTKQVGVELELPKSTPKDVTPETQQTPETVIEEPEVEQVTPDQVERRSSRTIRALDRYSPSLHYLLLTDEEKPEFVAEAL